MIDGTRKYLSVHILYTKESLGKKQSEWKQFDIGRIHLQLTDGPSVKWVIKKTILFCIQIQRNIEALVQYIISS